jgi:hypothetical protein
MAAQTRVNVRWDGREWSVDGELVSLDERWSLWETSYRPREVVVRAPLGDLRDWIKAGHHHHTMTVEVYLGTRLVAVSGVSRLVHGRSAGEWSEIEAAERPAIDQSQIPSRTNVRMRYVDIAATERVAGRAYAKNVQGMYENLYGTNAVRPINYVGSATWETQYATRTEGRVYPIVFGSPGVDGTQATQAIPIDLDNGILMVAGHECRAGAVVVYGPSGLPGELENTASDTLTISHTEDQNGQRVAVVDVSASTALQGNWPTVPEAAEREWYVSWSSTASGVSGAAADVVALLLSHVRGITVDFASIEGARDHLRGYELDGVIDEQVRAWDVLVDQVIPLLPVRLVPTLGGVGLAVVRLDFTATEARRHLREGCGVIGSSRPARRSDDDGVFNDWTVEYSASRRTQRLRKRARRSGGNSAVARRSADVHGVRASAVQTRWVYRTSVAERIASDMVELYAPDRQTIAYEVDAEVYGRGAPEELSSGMPVLITDEQEGYSEALAVVAGIVRDGSRVDRVLLLLL